jgi:putative hydrolase of the HAD superfamily
VLVHIEPAAFLRSLALDTPNSRAFYQPHVVNLARRYERGDDSTDVFFANLHRLFNDSDKTYRHPHGSKRNFTEGDFRRAMLSIIGAPVEGMEQIVRRVSASVPVGLLSNTNPVHIEYCLRTFHVLQLIPSHFFSYQLNAFKPEPEIFEHVLKQILFPPEEILYIDDLIENVDAAERAGMIGHQFVGVDNIRQVLAELQLI